MFRRILPLLLLCISAGTLATGSACAQALPTATGPGPYIAVGVTGSIFNTDYGKTNIAGPTIFVDANIRRRWGLEGEARFLRYHQTTGIQQDEYLIGPRYAFKDSHLVPYVKFPVGLTKMQFPYGYGTGHYFVMAPGGGFDYWLNDRVRLRLVDFEYQLWPQFTFGTLHPYGASAGVSFRVF